MSDAAERVAVVGAAGPPAGGLDPRLFAAAPRDARERMTLESAHAALEDAGYDVTGLGGRARVFGDSAGLVARALRLTPGPDGGSGEEDDPLADAADALLDGDCDLAVVCGVRAERGEVVDGAGALVLRRYGDALLDGDDVRLTAGPDLAFEPGPDPVHTPHLGRPRIVVWSALDAETAGESARRLGAWFAGLGGDRFADAVATLQLGRTRHPARGAVVCASPEEAAAALAAPPPAREGAGGPVVFHFPAGCPERMGLSLYGAQRVFTETFDECLEAFEHEGVTLYGDWPAGAPLRFAVQHALTAAWRDWGVEPAAATGEPVAAAVAAGELPWREAVRLVARGLPYTRETPAPPPGATVLVLGEPAGPADTEEAAPGEPGPVACLGDERRLMEAVAELWARGHDVDWAGLDRDHQLRRVPAPGYPPVRGDALTPTQRAFWFLERLAPGTGVSNVGMAWRIARPARWWPLHAAARHLLRRHPALRMRFPEEGGVPAPRLVPADEAEIEVETRRTTEEDLVADVREWIHRPFDLAKDVLFRVASFTLPDGAGVVAIAGHHIVTDAPSYQILHEELCRLYDVHARRAEIPAELRDEVPMPGEPEPDPEDVAYWVERLRGVRPEAMELAGARPAPRRPTFAGHTVSRELRPEARTALDRLRKELRVTDNIVLMTAFCLTLLRHGAGPDLVVGVPVAVRRAAGARAVGLGFSTMPLRVEADPEAGFAELARRVQDAFLEGVEHAGVSAETIVTERGHGTSDWRVPLFRHMFNYRPWTGGTITMGGAPVSYVEDLYGRSRVDLQLVAVPEPDRITVRAWYSTEIHDEAEIVAFIERMAALLERAAEEIDRPLRGLPLATAADRAALAAVNDTAREWPGPGTLLPRIIAAGRAGPGRIAVVDGDRAVTYADLLAEAARVRDRLRAEGVRPGDVVALALPRSASLAAAVLGVWAAGAGYLPLDARQPPLRLSYQVEDAGARLVVAAAPVDWAGHRPVLTWPSAAAPGASRTPEGGRAPEGDRGAEGDPAAGLDGADGPGAGDVAYVIYTSGSTGRPKGVAVRHGNLANLVLDFAWRLGEGRSALWSTTTSFDISGLELFLPLATGGRLVVAPDEAQLRPRDLLGLIERHDVEVVQATPTAWRLIAPELGGPEPDPAEQNPTGQNPTGQNAAGQNPIEPDPAGPDGAGTRETSAAGTAGAGAGAAGAGGALAGRIVLCGGEPMPAALARRLLAAGCRLFNVYGPTETTIWSTAAEITEDPRDPVTVGRPIANTRVFLADPGLPTPEVDEAAELPPGLPGELCIAGDGVAAGYAGRPELTAERFGEHPVHGRFYRTGDLARLRPGGTLEVLGRADRQVKLRGHRIELGEVEAVLHEHPEVRATAVVVDGDPQSDGRLLAFVQTAAPPGRDPREELWRYARERLPDYAVPSGFALVEGFPTTANDKIDYRALAALAGDGADVGGGPATAEPVADEEVAPLVELFRATLGRPGFGPRDNFFVHGGHSILAVRLAARIEELTGGPVDVRAVFDHPSPAGLAAHLRGAR
ncbi:AMP-binding protein [Bailinhaonella thermotolerans]|uniref:Carrier domain-containing protein n=1 Tax=Bailinhaonella thermotolerans TaxID=1070861 RepID=A0A3A4AU20_9ACTN|nr:AMP-binding protein [Bailinhaonella thermotolerans]RJL31795.1 hypothetical protein D5H75_19080 [Bailinhaonella thermotolerans]